MRTYYAELTRAAQTGRTARLRTLVHRNCPCFGAVESIQDVANKGFSTPNATWTLESLRVRELAAGQAFVEVRYRVNAHDLIGPDGERADSFPEKRRHLEVSLARSDSRWVVTNLFDLES